MENKIKMSTSLLEELRIRKKEIKCAENFKQKKYIEYKNKVKDVELFISMQNAELEKLIDKKIYFSAESLVEEIAKKCNTSVDNLNVDINFIDTERAGTIGKNKFLELCSRQGIYVEITISTTDNSYRFYTTIKVNLLDFQKDGRRLKDCVEVETNYKTNCKGVFAKTNLVCPDYKNLTFSNKLKYMIDANGDEFVPVNENCELMLKASERDIQKRNEESLNI